MDSFYLLLVALLAMDCTGDTMNNKLSWNPNSKKGEFLINFDNNLSGVRLINWLDLTGELELHDEKVNILGKSRCNDI